MASKNSAKKKQQQQAQKARQEQIQKQTLQMVPGVPILVSKGKNTGIEPLYQKEEEEILETIIQEELEKLGYKGGILPSVLRRKLISTILFALACAGWLILGRFWKSHLPTGVWFILLIFYIRFQFKYNTMRHIKKQIKARPDDDMSNIIASIVYGYGRNVNIPDEMAAGVDPDKLKLKTFDKSDVENDPFDAENENAQNTSARKNSVPQRADGQSGSWISRLTGWGGRVVFLVLRIVIIMVGLLVPEFMFAKPHMFFEHADGGYYLRFYTQGSGDEDEANVVIPDTWKGEPVIGIRGDVFEGMDGIETITLPETMEVIRGKAFADMEDLKEMILPESVTYLGGSAFKGDSSLAWVQLPLHLDEIAGETFKNCTSLQSVMMPEKMSRIGGEAFAGCVSLNYIVLPEGLTEIHGNCFENCSSIEAIAIPEGVTRIGGHAFFGCQSLTEVYLPSTLQEIDSSAFRYCTQLQEVTVPEGCSINERAFKESPTEVIYATYAE